MINYIIKFYNNNTFLYYVYRWDEVGRNIDKAEFYHEYENADDLAEQILERLFKKFPEYSMSKHTYDHLREDYFDNIPKKKLKYKIVNYNMENRLIKLKKIINIINERQN